MSDALPELNAFRIIHPIGHGPSGAVYKARRLAEQDVVAVKVLADAPGRAGRARAVQAAAERAALIKHPNAVRTLECVQDGEHTILVMEYVAGDPLGRALQRNVRFNPTQSFGIARQVAQALQAAAALTLHHGALHPDQILLHEETARVLGLGLGEILPNAYDGPLADNRFSPLLYAAPEIITRALTTPAADICSLGLILYHLLTGYPPYRGDSHQKLFEARRRGRLSWPRGTVEIVGEPAVLLVERMSAPEPDKRPADYDELLAAMDVCFSGGAGGEEGAREAGGALAARQREDASLLLIKDEAPVPKPIVTALFQHRKSGLWVRTAAMVAVFLLAIAVGLRAFLSGPSKPLAENVAADAGQKSALEAFKPGEAGEAGEPDKTQTAYPADKPEPRRLTIPWPAGAGAGTDLAQDEYDMIVRFLMDHPNDADIRAVAIERLKALAEKYPEHRASLLAQVRVRKLVQTLDGRYERLYEVIDRRARGYAAREHFGRAVKKYNETDRRGGVWRAKAEAAIQEIKTQLAPAAFKHAAAEAAAHEAAGRMQAAVGVLGRVADRFGLEPWVSKARAEIERLGGLQEQRALAVQTQRERERQTAVQGQVPELLLQVRADCANFRYARARERIAELRSQLAAGQRDLSAFLEEYSMAVKLERWFFQRAAERVNTGMRSAVIGSRKTRISEEILMIDAEGILSRYVPTDEKTGKPVAGAGSIETKRSWQPIPDPEVIKLFRLAMDKHSVDEQLGLAVMAFHRNEPDDMERAFKAALAADRDAGPAVARTQALFLKLETILKPRKKRRGAPAPKSDAPPRRKRSPK